VFLILEAIATAISFFFCHVFFAKFTLDSQSLAL
jgi:hypothetical protein